jgi:hypothetical protein
VVVGGRKVAHRVHAELRHRGRKDELVQPESGAGAIDFQEQVEPGKGGRSSHLTPGFRVLARERPGVALLLEKFAPVGGDVAEIAPDAQLGRGPGVLGDRILPLDLAVARSQIDCVADLAGLRDIKFYTHNSCQAGPAAPFTLRAPAARAAHRRPVSPMADWSINQTRRASPFLYRTARLSSWVLESALYLSPRTARVRIERQQTTLKDQ